MVAELGRLAPAGATRINLGSAAVFDVRRQMLVGLNDTSAWIWDRIAAGDEAVAVARELSFLIDAEAQVAADQASAYVAEAVTDWLARGWLMPAYRPERPVRRGLIRLGGVELSIAVEGDLSALTADAPWLSALWVDRTGLATPDIVLGHWEGWWDVRTDAPVTMVSRHALAAPLKALVTDVLTRQAGDGFWVHAGLVDFGWGPVLIMGPPGAGKSTLCGAAAAAGAKCLADDVTRVHGDGRVEGVAFPLTLKTGSWTLLPDAVAEAEVHERADGQSVRYGLNSVQAMSAPVAAAGICFLKRGPGVAPAMTPVEPTEALRRILDEGYSPGHRIEADLLLHLVDTVTTTPCFELVYEDAHEAVSRLAAHGG